MPFFKAVLQGFSLKQGRLKGGITLAESLTVFDAGFAVGRAIPSLAILQATVGVEFMHWLLDFKNYHETLNAPGMRHGELFACIMYAQINTLR